MTKRQFLSALIGTVVMFWCGFWFGGLLSYGELTSVLDLLVMVSTLVVTVMGAWLALVFPDVLRKAQSASVHAETLSLATTSNRVLLPLIIATFCVVTNLITRVIGMFTAAASLLLDTTILLKCLAGGVVAGTTWLLVVALFWTLYPAAATHLRIERAEEKSRQQANTRDGRQLRVGV